MNNQNNFIWYGQLLLTLVKDPQNLWHQGNGTLYKHHYLQTITYQPKYNPCITHTDIFTLQHSLSDWSKLTTANAVTCPRQHQVSTIGLHNTVFQSKTEHWHHQNKKLKNSQFFSGFPLSSNYLHLESKPPYKQ